MKIGRICCVLSIVLSASFPSHAEPTDGVTSVLWVRPYTEPAGYSGKVYVKVTNSNMCNTDTFVIELSRGGGREAYAAALAAHVSGYRVQIEMAPPCNGVNTLVQSIFVWK